MRANVENERLQNLHHCQFHIVSPSFASAKMKKQARKRGKCNHRTIIIIFFRESAKERESKKSFSLSSLSWISSKGSECVHAAKIRIYVIWRGEKKEMPRLGMQKARTTGVKKRDSNAENKSIYFIYIWWAQKNFQSMLKFEPSTCLRLIPHFVKWLV